jgi:methionine salvage enolase-phosphatase E1
MLELSKTNPKKNQFTVNLYADDKRIERKDKAINEPVYFYVQGASSALELVVNKLGKDSISGYVSTPKGFFAGTPNVLAARPGA